MCPEEVDAEQAFSGPRAWGVPLGREDGGRSRALAGTSASCVVYFIVSLFLYFFLSFLLSSLDCLLACVVTCLRVCLPVCLFACLPVCFLGCFNLFVSSFVGVY